MIIKYCCNVAFLLWTLTIKNTLFNKDRVIHLYSLKKIFESTEDADITSRFHHITLLHNTITNTLINKWLMVPKHWRINRGHIALATTTPTQGRGSILAFVFFAPLIDAVVFRHRVFWSHLWNKYFYDLLFRIIFLYLSINLVCLCNARKISALYKKMKRDYIISFNLFSTINLYSN